MKITVEHYDKKIIIENDYDDLTMDEVMDDFIRPLLAAIGYHQDLIDDYIGECDCEEDIDDMSNEEIVGNLLAGNIVPTVYVQDDGVCYDNE